MPKPLSTDKKPDSSAPLKGMAGDRRFFGRTCFGRSEMGSGRNAGPPGGAIREHFAGRTERVAGERIGQTGSCRDGEH
jgi:hypothetical protein